jgi:hypothetical protein
MRTLTEERELGYYWVEWETKDNWLIFWFNGGSWQCVAMGNIDLNDNNILSVDESKPKHRKLSEGTLCKAVQNPTSKQYYEYVAIGMGESFWFKVDLPGLLTDKDLEDLKGIKLPEGAKVVELIIMPKEK